MPPPPTKELPAYIAELESSTLAALRQRWAEVFGKPAPVAARSEYLIRAIAFRIQEDTCSRPTASIARRIKKVAGASTEKIKSSLKLERKLQVGARLLREWQGETHEVEIASDGYRYGGDSYSSLSQIARLITGTRWSGPLFFGLKNNSSKAVKPKNRVEVAHGL